MKCGGAVITSGMLIITFMWINSLELHPFKIQPQTLCTSLIQSQCYNFSLFIYW